jgi:hypothetical protein
MATQAQYGVFLYLYEDENKRYEHLQDRAKLYLSIASIYLGAIAFKVDDVLRLVTQFRIPVWLWLMTGGILIAAVVLISWAVPSQKRVASGKSRSAYTSGRPRKTSSRSAHTI